MTEINLKLHQILLLISTKTWDEKEQSEELTSISSLSLGVFREERL